MRPTGVSYTARAPLFDFCVFVNEFCICIAYCSSSRQQVPSRPSLCFDALLPRFRLKTMLEIHVGSANGRPVFV